MMIVIHDHHLQHKIHDINYHKQNSKIVMIITAVQLRNCLSLLLVLFNECDYSIDISQFSHWVAVVLQH